jgi:acyl-CoA synthetase (AMP-forming)/AMP-acid ligase II
MIQALVAHPDAHIRDLSSLRCLNYAAPPTSETTLARAIEIFGNDVQCQMYAQSEAWPITMLLPHQHEDRPRSVGRATPNNVITIVDEEGNPLPVGKVGEIAVRGGPRMLELWKEAEATAARTLPDGSRLTRDMGRLDEEGSHLEHLVVEGLLARHGYSVEPSYAVAREP